MKTASSCSLTNELCHFKQVINLCTPISCVNAGTSLPYLLHRIQITERGSKSNSTYKARKTQTQDIPDTYDVSFAQLGSSNSCNHVVLSSINSKYNFCCKQTLAQEGPGEKDRNFELPISPIKLNLLGMPSSLSLSRILAMTWRERPGMASSPVPTPFKASSVGQRQLRPGVSQEPFS